MKRLFFILLLLPIFCSAQVKPTAKDSVLTLNYGNTTFDPSILEKLEVGTITIIPTTIVTDRIIKEYIDWCYKDSTYVKYVVDYTPKATAKNDTLDLTGAYMTISLYSTAGEWRHKEPTFIGFYEWLKNKTK